MEGGCVWCGSIDIREKMRENNPELKFGEVRAPTPPRTHARTRKLGRGLCGAVRRGVGREQGLAGPCAACDKACALMA